MVPIQRSSKTISRASLDKSLPPMPHEVGDEKTERDMINTTEIHDMTKATVLIGPRQQPFEVDRERLCAVSPFFHDRFSDWTPSKPISLWLPGESTTMFALFVEWLHSPRSFRAFLDCALSAAYEASPRAFQDLHWAIIRLHLFAAQLYLHRLQDIAMDTIQDLYLQCDWDVPAALVTYLYTECEAMPAVRLRRWTVAMVAFSMTIGAHLQTGTHPQDPSTSDPSRFHALLDSLPEFAEDYTMHLRNMRASGLDVRFKNPQLRIAANDLRNDQRLFGFRECSFHSHRSTVGEGSCPHATDRRRRRQTVQSKAESEEVSFGITLVRDENEDPQPRPLFSTISEEDEEEEMHRLLSHSQLTPIDI